ncbi:MAG: GAF domain-containing protein [FCB group bacterium]|nr:GAF domain-containing protein [FCB group bacterium]
MKRLLHKKEFLDFLHIVNEIDQVCQNKKLDNTSGEKILNKLRKLIKFDAASLYLYNLGKKKLEYIASFKEKVEVLGFLELNKGEGLSGWAADSMKPLLLSDRSRKNGFDPDKDFASFMAVPISLAKEIIGVINLGNKAPDFFDHEDVQLMSTIAGQIAFSLSKVIYQKRYEDLKTRYEDNKNKLLRIKSETIYPREAVDIARQTASIIHRINNSLAVIIGNIQYMLAGNTVIKQKTLSRLKHMEQASLDINKANQMILEINQQIDHTFEDNDVKKEKIDNMVWENE